MEFESLIDTLKDRLKKPLPGKDCQYLMAASDRTGNNKIPIADKPKRDAAILILLYKKNNKTYTVLIKRPVYNGVHSGQISFPGGKKEDIDRTIIDTALRESKEEIGVKISNIDILGQLSTLLIPVSNIEVFPVVGYSKEIPSFVIDKKEVNYTIEVAISDLLDPKNKKTKEILIHNQKVIAPYFDIQNETIWGATAMIINELKCVLN